jgi:hypothetical protein
MSKFTEKEVVGLSECGLGLDDLVRQGARQVIQQAIEAELSALLERFENVKTLHGQRAVVRNGYLPEREVLTAAGPIAVKVPKVRDRSGVGCEVQFLDCSAVCEEVAARECRATVAVSEGHLDGRHERGARCAAGRGRQGVVGERGKPPEGAMDR